MSSASQSHDATVTVQQLELDRDHHRVPPAARLGVTVSITSRPVDHRSWKGKPRACLRCQRIRRSCHYVESPMECSTCLSVPGVKCSGPALPSTESKLKRQVRKLSVLPSAAGRVLVDTTLSMALSLHLIEAFRELNGMSSPQLERNVYTFPCLINVLKRSRDRKTDFPEVEEIVSVLLMFIGAQVSRAVISQNLANQLPPSKILVHNFKGNELLLRLSGESRHRIIFTLRERLLLLVDKFVRGNPVITSADLSSVVWAVDWLFKNSIDDQLVEILHQLLDKAMQNLREGRVTASDVAPYKDQLDELLLTVTAADWFSAKPPLDNVTVRWYLTTLTWIQELPALPPFTSEEVDFLVATERYPLLDRQRIATILVHRVIHPRLTFGLATHMRLIQLLEGAGQLEKACKFCWASIQTLSQSNAIELDRLLLHPNFGDVPSRGTFHALHTLMSAEVQRCFMLSVCHQRALQLNIRRLVDTSRLVISRFLTRISNLWEMMKIVITTNYPVRSTDNFQYLQTFHDVKTALQIFKGPLLRQWVQSSPEEAIILLEPLHLASYFSIEASQLAWEVQDALDAANKAETVRMTLRALEKEEDFSGIIAQSIVEGALSSIVS